MTTDDSLALCTKLMTLPQELYDEIYDLTFTASAASDMYTLPKHSQTRPAVFKLQQKGIKYTTLKISMLHLLHVDRESRTKYAKSFYSLSRFVVCGYSQTVHLFDAIAPEHRPLVRSMCILHTDGVFMERYCGIVIGRLQRRFGVEIEVGFQVI